MSNNSVKYHFHFRSSLYPGASPWTFKEKMLQILWRIVWRLFCSWTPKHLISWRLFFLKTFGCKIYGKPFVHQTAIISIPWNLTIHDKCCIGDMVNLYSLDKIELGEGSIIAQESYLCTGTHDFTHPNRPLLTAKITIGDRVFIGARSFIMPGMTIGNDVIIGACSVVTKDVPAHSLVAGNPAKQLRK